MTIKNLIEYEISIQSNDIFYAVWFDLYKGEISACITKTFNRSKFLPHIKYELDVLNGLKLINRKTL